MKISKLQNPQNFAIEGAHSGYLDYSPSYFRAEQTEAKRRWRTLQVTKFISHLEQEHEPNKIFIIPFLDSKENNTSKIIFNISSCIYDVIFLMMCLLLFSFHYIYREFLLLSSLFELLHSQVCRRDFQTHNKALYMHWKINVFFL